ncbi:MAG: hypothetical protein AAF497_11395, partial [Planctomycetota bacterium]
MDMAFSIRTGVKRRTPAFIAWPLKVLTKIRIPSCRVAFRVEKTWVNYLSAFVAATIKRVLIKSRMKANQTSHGVPGHCFAAAFR